MFGLRLLQHIQSLLPKNHFRWKWDYIYWDYFLSRLMPFSLSFPHLLFLRDKRDFFIDITRLFIFIACHIVYPASKYIKSMVFVIILSGCLHYNNDPNLKRRYKDDNRLLRMMLVYFALVCHHWKITFYSFRDIVQDVTVS